MASDKLSRLGAKSVGTSQEDTKAKLQRFEISVGAALPKAYADLLIQYGTPVVFERDVRFRPVEKSPWDRKDGTQSLELLYGLNGDKQDLARQHEVYTRRMPEGIIPIGEAPGGNIIGLGIRRPATGKVYFWDHENERPITGVMKNDFGNMHLIAPSFEEFMESLYAVKDDSEEKSDGIADVWLDENL